MKKRLLSILTALCLCLTLLPGTVLANEGSGAVLAEEGGEAETAVSPYSEVTITAHQPLKHAPVLGTLDASAVDETVTPRRGMFFYKGMSGVAEITDLTAYQAGEADSLRRKAVPAPADLLHAAAADRGRPLCLQPPAGHGVRHAGGGVAGHAGL